MAKIGKRRNEDARALGHRAGNAHVAVAVDTRAKIVRPLKGAGSYRRVCATRFARFD